MVNASLEAMAEALGGLHREFGDADTDEAFRPSNHFKRGKKDRTLKVQYWKKGSRALPGGLRSPEEGFIYHGRHSSTDAAWVQTAFDKGDRPCPVKLGLDIVDTNGAGTWAPWIRNGGITAIDESTGQPWMPAKQIIAMNWHVLFPEVVALRPDVEAIYKNHVFECENCPDRASFQDRGAFLAHREAKHSQLIQSDAMTAGLLPLVETMKEAVLSNRGEPAAASPVSPISAIVAAMKDPEVREMLKDLLREEAPAPAEENEDLGNVAVDLITTYEEAKAFAEANGIHIDGRVKDLDKIKEILREALNG